MNTIYIITLIICNIIMVTVTLIGYFANEKFKILSFIWNIIGSMFIGTLAGLVIIFIELLTSQFIK